MIKHLLSICLGCLCILKFGATPADHLKADITLILVDETKACSPEGYENYSKECPNVPRPGCKTLLADEVRKLSSTAVEKKNVPPGTIDVSPILPQIRTFVRECPFDEPCCNPTKRSSVIILIEWSERVSGTVRLVRPEVEGLKRYVNEDRLKNARRWLDHQRADLFMPGYGITWKLTVEGETWELTTTKGSS